MCGVTGIFGKGWERAQLAAMTASLRHRGPDTEDIYVNLAQTAGLGHTRLSIIDLSENGRQPMPSADGRLRVVFNGEIYNYLELRAELGSYPFRTETDTEVILAAYERWGDACLERFVGMFAILIWDEAEGRLFAARDRFGVKPLYYLESRDALFLASESKAFKAAGLALSPDAVTWATYLAHGLYDHTERTFNQEVRALPAGHTLTWQDGGRAHIKEWYDLAERASKVDESASIESTQEQYINLLSESVRLRFRSDVSVGINLSGGLDSSTLLGLVQKIQGRESEVKAFTFVTGDEAYDELPWVREMLAQTRHPLSVCRLAPEDVPALAASVQAFQDEPFGGLPTLAYARLFERARAEGVIVLLDGQGMDEQWAGYDYYRKALRSGASEAGVVQGTQESPVRPECLTREMLALAQPFTPARPFRDKLRDLQYRDIRYTKLPRALRFNDRASMRASVELREPFLDHRLFELALPQPAERKIKNETGKWLLRKTAREMLPSVIVEAPKRALQTPQREWLRGPLKGWAAECLEATLDEYGGLWLERDAVRARWRDYLKGASDNSFYIWQWVNLGLMTQGGAYRN